MGSHSFFQVIFLTQVSNPGLLHCRQILYHLSHWGSPFYLVPGIISSRASVCNLQLWVQCGSRSVMQGTNFLHQSRTAVLKQDDFAQSPPLLDTHTHSCTNSRDIWQCLKILLVVQLIGGGLLCTYSRQRPGMLLDILQCTGHPSQQSII